MTKAWIVTVILSSKELRNTKGMNECPLGGFCDAPSGRHHSMLVWSQTGEAARAKLEQDGYYVARVEIANTTDVVLELP